jgi:hypothetical protein
MYNNNTRFNDLGDGLISELIATKILINYDPNTSNATVFFDGTPMITTNAGYKSVGNSLDRLRINVGTRIMETPPPEICVDPVTQQDLSNVSVAGIFKYILYKYNQWHNEVNNPPEPSPTPDEEPTPTPEVTPSTSI